MNTLRFLKALAFILLMAIFLFIALLVTNAKAASITKTFTASWIPFTQAQVDQYNFVNIELFDKDNKSISKTTNALIAKIDFTYTFEENEVQAFYLKANMKDGNATANSSIYGFYIYKDKLLLVPFPENKNLKIQIN